MENTKIRLFTEAEVVQLIARFGFSWNTEACNFDSVEYTAKEIVDNNMIAFDEVPGNLFVVRNDVFVLSKGRLDEESYSQIIIPVKS